MLYEPLLIVRDCGIQGRTDLGPGTYAEPHREPLGFRGEVEFLFGLPSELGIKPFDRVFKARTVAAVAHEQPTAIIHFPTEEATDPETAEASVRPAMLRAISILSWLSANPVRPIGIVLRRGTEASIRVLPPQWSRLQHLNGYLSAVPGVSTAAENDPRIALMLEAFREAMAVIVEFQGENPRAYDTRLLVFGQLFEIACGDLDDRNLWPPYENTLANRLRRRTSEIGLGERLARLPSELGVAMPEGNDGCDLIADVRNTLAHRGALELSRFPYVQGLASARRSLDREVREVAREVIAALADWDQSGISTSPDALDSVDET